jgi:beta-glucanase (GH16 family)
MKRILYFPALYLLAVIGLAGCEKKSAVTPTTPDNGGTTPTEPTPRKLVWSDEFDYTGLPNSTLWSYDVGGSGWGNQELQYYTDKRAENARVENGMLVIEARKENFDAQKYTSARLVTKNKGDWQYGRIEVRAKLPKGRGTWAAIWMLASTPVLKWPDDGEIDIMEHVGYDQGMVHSTVHTKAFNHALNTQKGNSLLVPDASEAFHVYAVDWTWPKLVFYVDDKVVFTFENQGTGEATYPFAKKFHLLLNIAVGGSWGGAKGIDETVFPQRMEIDWVRVYQ